MLNMKMPFNYLGIKGDSGKCRLLTGLDGIIVMPNNLITHNWTNKEQIHNLEGNNSKSRSEKCQG